VPDLILGPGSEPRASRSADTVDPSQPTGRGQPVVPAGWRARWLAKCKESVWAPIAVKAAGIGVLMTALAGIGAASIATGATRGVAVPSGLPLVADVSSAWLRVTGPSNAAPKTDPSAAPASSASAGAPGESAPAPRSPGVTADGKVILNQASADDLMHLPGIGKKRADAILALRTRLGRFKRPTDLLRVKGLGPKRLHRLLPRMVLDPPPEPASTS
jgi:competence protein ComEA